MVFVEEPGLLHGESPAPKPVCDEGYAPPAHRVKLLARKHAHERDERIRFYEGPHKYVVDGDVMSISVTGIAGLHREQFDENLTVLRMQRSKREPWPKLKYTVGAHRLGSEQGAPKALIVDDDTGLTLAHVDVNPGETAGAVTARLLELTGKSAGVTVHGYLRAMTSEEVLASWEHTRSVASAEGTEAHYQMELLLNNDPHRAKDPEVVNGRKFLETVIAGLGATIYRTEWEIFSEASHIAGSVDAILRKPDGKLVIVDWTRSDKLECHLGSYERRKFMRSPFQHLEDCDGGQYALQLSLYRYILEKEYGFECAELFVCSIHPDRPFHKQLPYLEREVRCLMEQRAAWFSAWREASEESPAELRCAVSGRLPLKPVMHESRLVDASVLLEDNPRVEPVDPGTMAQIKSRLPTCTFTCEPLARVDLVQA